ncbi:hypothetical protein BN3589_03345 [Clostridium sp. C105KSO14]|nr:hypothetical protein BN3589_03345 [Clostridium sp. C105KSO14]
MGSSLNESIICYFPYLPKENGNTSEIDLLLFVNIYMYLSRNYSGWIFKKGSICIHE